MAKRDKGSPVLVVIGLVVVLLLLPMIYVLSVGPAVRMVHTGSLSEHAAETIYYPLIVIHEALPPVGVVLDRYIELFEPPAPSTPVPVTPAPATAS